MNELPDIIIGSGPTGVSAAFGRLAKGKSVVMLDAGQLLETQKTELRDRLGANSPTDWPKGDLEIYKAGQFEAPAGAIRKFGSDYAVEEPQSVFAEDYKWLGLRSSRAQGGLSQVWGASVLPSAASDISDWPINSTDLEPHYKAVSEFMPISGRSDAIGTVYPAFDMSDKTPLPFTPQAAELIRRVDLKDGQIGEVSIGAARNAVSSGCVQCGLCLHGCPYGHIWTASDALATLRRNPGFTYRANAIVVGLSEHKDSVSISLSTGETVEGRRVFVAAGVLETARLYLKSFPDLGALSLLDSHHFFTPFLHRWRVSKDVEARPHHTLSSAFVEFMMGEQDRFVHAQLYTWNEQYLRDMMANFGSKIPFSKPVFEALSRRLIVAQSFLHSDYSGRIGLRLTAGQDRIIAENLSNPETSGFVRQARSKLGASLKPLGLIPLSRMGRDGLPGSSFHVGGSLGMSDTPSKSRSDILGRLHGLERVHAVDASVMTSIPASTITFTAMANAHRIAAKTP